MKKLGLKIGDILIIIFVLISIILINMIATNKYKVLGNNLNIEIVYKNEIVVKTKLNINSNFIIKSSDDLEKVIILKDNNLYKELNIKNKNNFYNEISIKNNKVYMVDADCKNKDCMRIYIDESHILPIICTNGVSVRLVNSNDIIDDIS